MNDDSFLLRARLSVSLHVFLRGGGQLMWRPSPFVPRVGELIVRNDIRYRVEKVEWCMDSDSTPDYACRVNIEVTKRAAGAKSGA